MPVAGSPSYIALFLGVTPRPFREYLAPLLKAARARYTRLLNPCVGRLTIPWLAVKQGWNPSAIRASDISLFSTILGEYAAGRDLRALKIELHDMPELDCLESCWDGGINHAAAALYACAWAARKDAGSYYHRQLLRDFELRRDDYLMEWRQRIETLAGACRGMEYAVSDIWDEIPGQADAQTLLYTDPPIYGGGYGVMFDYKGRVTWNDPQIAEFRPEDVGRLTDRIMEFPGLAIVFTSRAIPEAAAAGGLFACQMDPTRVDYLWTNRPEEAKSLHAIGCQAIGLTEIKAVAAPILTDEDPLTRGSRVSFIAVSREQAMYYRDLWAHNLGTTSAQGYVAALVDGKLFAIAGLYSTFMGRGDIGGMGPGEYLWLQFAMSPPSRRHLNRLFIRLMVTEEFYWVANAALNLGISGQKGVETTWFSRHSSTMVYRGIMRVEKREAQHDGSWRIIYRQEWQPKTLKAAFREWLRLEDARSPQEADADATG